MTTNSKLGSLERLVGAWTTEATHPAMPGVVVQGTARIEWLEGARFLIYRSRNDHPDFPDAISIIGHTESDRVDHGENTASKAHGEQQLRMHYYDSRGVYREYEASIDETSWRLQRLAPGFSQRFVGTFAEGGKTIDGLWQLREDDRNWRDDLKIIYRRATGSD
jgi:hypothetical protein